MPGKFKNLFQIPGLNGMSGMGNFQKQMEQFLSEDFIKQFQSAQKDTDTSAPYNLYENELELLYIFSLPGIQNLDTLQVRLQGKTLLVNGNITIQHSGFELKTSNIFSGDFNYTIDLPCRIRHDKIEASYENGLLQILLFKILANRHESEIIPVTRIGK